MSLHDELITQLKEGEAEIELIRPHPITMMPSVGVGAILLIIDFFLVAWWFRLGNAGVIGFALGLGLAGFLIGRGWFEWSHNALLITTHRIMDITQRGFFRRTMAEATYDKIQDVRSSVSGIWSTIFQFGSVVVQTAGSQTSIEIHGLRRPQSVQQLIAETQAAAARSAHDDLSAEELVAMVERLKRHLGPEEFQRVTRRPKV